MKVSARKHGGFTLLEVMLVVAILSVLMGLAVPGAVSVSRNMRLTKLDDIAREIYTSAQSQAISLSVSGQLNQVGGSNTVVTVAAGDPARTKTLKCITNQPDPSGAVAPGAELLLPLGSMDAVARQNYYLIEYDPATATVQGVYYWENADNTFLTDTTNGYNGTVRSREYRMNYSGGMVGYYGGDNTGATRPGAPATGAVSAELVNGEELYLKITKGFGGSEPLKGTVTVTLRDMDKPGSADWVIPFRNETGRKPAADPSVLGEVIENLDLIGNTYQLTLDGLRSSRRFSKLFPERGDGSFHPGCELKVTVAFQEDGKLSTAKTFHTNSLYASVAESAGGRTAYIACGRHLENLGLLWVYPGKEADTADTLNGVTEAKLTQDIDWHTTLDHEHAGHDAVSFKPIVNENLKVFDGLGHTISHANIIGNAPDTEMNTGGLLDGYTGHTDGIGLISRFMGTGLKNVKLVDCVIKGLTGSADYVGLLAGKIEPSGTCEVSGCQAYATKNGSLNQCSIAMPEGTNTNRVGGLFGYVRSATITKCSASLTEITGNAEYAGGLAGETGTGCEVTSCYADTGVRGSVAGVWQSGISGQTVGGLLGSVSGSLTLNYSYAVGWVKSGAARGLVGSGSAGSVDHCYAAMLNSGGVVAELVSSGSPTNCYNFGGGYDDSNTLIGTKYVGEASNGGATHAYSMPAGDAYPFPRLTDMHHYGDWP